MNLPLPCLRALRLAAVLAGAALWPALRAETPSAAPAAPAVAAGATLTLDDAIRLALRRNPRIRVSDFGRGIARANVLTEYGRFDPAITFRRSYSESQLALGPDLTASQLNKTDDYSLALEGFTPWGMSYQIGGQSQNARGTYNNLSNTFVTFGGVSVTQPLLRGFGFGANLATLRIAKADRAISDWDYRQTVIDTVTNVIVAYTDLEEAHENLRIAHGSRDLAAKLVTDNERRNQIGSLSDADVTQARARVADREELILLAERQVKATENRLRALIGEGGIAPDGADLPIQSLAPIATTTPDGAADLRTALELRPDYQAAKQGIVKNRANRAYARNQLLPQVDFVGSYGYNGLDSSFAESRAQVRDRDFRAYSAGVVVSVPLTFAQGRGRARAAKLQLQQAETDLERLEHDIAVNVANAIGQLETAGQRVQATSRAYDLAQQALNAEEKRFKAGTSSTFFVLQLQEQLASVEASKVRAIADQRRALAAYQHEIGTTLGAYKLQLK